MGRLIDLIDRGGCPLWIDGVSYAERLLADGHAPWLDLAGLVSWYRQTVNLLRSDVIHIALEPILLAWIDRDSALVADMRERKRSIYPLKALLAAEGLRDHVRDVLASLRETFGTAPLVLSVPLVGNLIDITYRAAHGGQADFGYDEIDSASVYVADFLRAFADTGLDAVLIGGPHDPVVADDIDLHAAIFNAAAHYRWDVGVCLGDAPLSRRGLTPQFIIAPQPEERMRSGLCVSAAFWDGEAAPPCPSGGLLFIEIPLESLPENVLERLRTLRAG